MQYCTRESFIDYVCVHANEYDFAAQCVSSWHLLGLKAYILEKIREIGFVKGVILVRCLKLDNYSIKEEDLIFDKNSDILKNIIYQVVVRNLKNYLNY